MRKKSIFFKVVFAFFCLSGILAFAFKSGILFASGQSLERSQPETLNQIKPVLDKTKANDVPEQIYTVAMARLKYLRETGCLEDVIKEGDEIEKEWGTNGGLRYGKLFLEFLDVLTSNRIVQENQKVLDLSQGYTIAALQKADSYDLETEWRLLSYLRFPVGIPSLDKEIGQSGGGIKLWLHAFRRLETEKDLNFNPNEALSMHAQPPEASGIPAGMAPEAIKDPKLRAEYEKAIEENNRKLMYFNEQYKLRQIERLILSGGLKYISMMYANSTSNLAELDKLMSEAKISKGLQKDIKIAAEKAVSSNQ